MVNKNTIHIFKSMMNPKASCLKKKKKTANHTYPWFHLIWNSQVGKTSVWQEKPKTTIVAYERAGVRFAGKGHGAASWVTGNVFILLEVWVTHFFPLLNLVEWCI